MQRITEIVLNTFFRGQSHGRKTEKIHLKYISVYVYVHTK